MVTWRTCPPPKLNRLVLRDDALTDEVGRPVREVHILLRNGQTRVRRFIATGGKRRRHGYWLRPVPCPQPTLFPEPT